MGVSLQAEIMYINYVLTTVGERRRSRVYLFTDKLDRSFFPCLNSFQLLNETLSELMAIYSVLSACGVVISFS